MTEEELAKWITKMPHSDYSEASVQDLLQSLTKGNLQQILIELILLN